MHRPKFLASRLEVAEVFLVVFIRRSVKWADKQLTGTRHLYLGPHKFTLSINLELSRLMTHQLLRDKYKHTSSGLVASVWNILKPFGKTCCWQRMVLQPRLGAQDYISLGWFQQVFQLRLLIYDRMAIDDQNFQGNIISLSGIAFDNYWITIAVKSRMSQNFMCAWWLIVCYRTAWDKDILNWIPNKWSRLRWWGCLRAYVRFICSVVIEPWLGQNYWRSQTREGQIEQMRNSVCHNVYILKRCFAVRD